MDFVGFSVCRIVSNANRDSLSLSLLFVCPVLLFLAGLLWLGPLQYWISAVKADNLDSFLILGESFQTFTTDYEVRCRFLRISALYHVKEVSFNYYFAECFIMKGVEFCHMLSVCMSVWLCLSPLILMWYVTLIDFQMLNHPCFPGVNLTLLWYLFLLRWCWIWFAFILLRIFTSMFIRDIGPSFSCGILVWLWY